MNERAINQAREKIAQLAGQNLDLVMFWQASTEALRHTTCRLAGTRSIQHRCW